MNYTKEKENDCTQPTVTSANWNTTLPTASRTTGTYYGIKRRTRRHSPPTGAYLAHEKKTGSVSYAGELEPPPGEGFDPFEREVHGPTVVLDDRAGKVTLESVDSSSSSENIDVWTCHYRWACRR